MNSFSFAESSVKKFIKTRQVKRQSLKIHSELNIRREIWKETEQLDI